MRGQSTCEVCRRLMVVVGVLVVWIAVAAMSRPAFAIIFGGTGNEPIAEGKELPAGAAAVLDSKTRVAWWEGPPLGGGQYHAECRGDTAAFNQVLADFAKVDVKTKRLVVQDGVGRSFWINPNRQANKQEDAKIDWQFMVWNPASWKRLRKLPPDLNPTNAKDAETGPPSQIDVYTGGNIRWDEVVVPDGVEVIDRRLEAHGFTPADGEVVEGKVVDGENDRPLAAKIRLEKSTAKPEGGYQYDVVAEATAAAHGNWVLRNVPEGSHRVVVEFEGYAARVAGYVQADGEPNWQSIDCKLSPVATLSGKVTDEAGKPLADVEVLLRDVTSSDGEQYRSPNDSRPKTDAAGRFTVKEVPVGKASISIYKPGYCRPGLGDETKIPADPIVLQMKQSGTVTVTVDFGAGQRAGEYIVSVEPEGGSKVGSWGGSAQINAENQHTFNDMPPGRYTFQGYPNPTTEKQKTATVTIDVVGGKKQEVKLEAR
jgi:hypothetical protein